MQAVLNLENVMDLYQVGKDIASVEKCVEVLEKLLGSLPGLAEEDAAPTHSLQVGPTGPRVPRIPTHIGLTPFHRIRLADDPFPPMGHTYPNIPDGVYRVTSLYSGTSLYASDFGRPNYPLGDHICFTDLAAPPAAQHPPVHDGDLWRYEFVQQGRWPSGSFFRLFNMGTQRYLRCPGYNEFPCADGAQDQDGTLWHAWGDGGVVYFEPASTWWVWVYPDLEGVLLC